jgi:mannose/fructose/N-acetylgalactosamine-specific phosphotransferase system component IIB
MMEMGAPADVRVEVLRLAIGAARINRDDFADRAAVVLFETPTDALRLLDMNVNIKKLNIGGMHFRPGKRQIMEGVSVDKEDCRALNEIAARHVEIYFQMVPQARPVEIVSRLPRDL